MAGSLVSRLNRMKSTGLAPGANTQIDRRERVLTAPGWERCGEFTYRRTVETACELPPSIDSMLLRRAGIDTELLRFFDTETTGLSSGAGSVVFLFGYGVVHDSTIRVEQVFLADYPGEAEFLRAVDAAIPSDAILVSYNGSSFDLPMLRSRFAMNGMTFDHTGHLDLLHVARRFWRDVLESCTLGTVEASVLSSLRVGDVPGAEIPDRYFDFLRNGLSEPLGQVFEHHRLDIVTLARLFATCEQILENPSSAGDTIDRRRVGTWLLSCGDERGLSLLHDAYLDGDVRAGLVWAVHQRRTGAYELAKDRWLEIWDSTGNAEAGLELAKHYEHRERRYERAIEIVETMLLDPKTDRIAAYRATNRSALAHRKARLVMKLDRRDSSPS